MASMTTVKDQERPYQPSWIDRFTHWVETLPMRAWVFYMGLGLVLILVQMLILWLDGGWQAEALLPVIIYNGLVNPFLLALIHLLDNQAMTALNSTRPALEMTKSEFDIYRYKLANMPSLPMLIAGLAMVTIAILVERLAGAPIRYAALERLPIFAVIFHIIDKGSAFLFGAFVFHTIRQLRLVNTINLHHIRVSLFNLAPLQAFSKLTASTAVGLVVGVYGWMVINPELLTNVISFGFTAVNTVLAIVVFVWPLLGVHRRIEMEKEITLHDIDHHFEAAFSDFNQRILGDDHEAIERLNRTISSLDIQHRRIKAIPAWPWRPETARFALTAIVLPLILMGIQFLVEQATK